MKEKHLVSVIVPVYNAECSVEKCVRSILAQSYANLEILLVNDGSTDASLRICNELAKVDFRINVIEQQNQGVSSARNRGIAESAGAYCCFVDADDWIEETHIEGLLSGLGDCDCVVQGYTKESSKGTEKCGLSPQIADLRQMTDRSILPFFADGYIHPCWNKLFCSRILKGRAPTLQFRRDTHISEDSLFCLEYLSCCNSMALSSETTYHYCTVSASSSLSKKVYPDIFQTYGRVYDELSALLKRGNCDRALSDEILTRTIYPQLYSAVVKIIRNNSMAQHEKKQFLDGMAQTGYCAAVFNHAKLLTSSRVEKLLLALIQKRRYRLLGVIWKKILK